MGNPKGLKYSVVSGVVSGRRAVEGRTMIQVAIPIEPGNSGGPLLDRRGRVVGLLTIKSLVTDNLGFAMPINALRPLIAKPSPVAMSAWRTIGVLDAEEWLLLGGANWRQRAGRISVEGAGKGFGGRALCLSRRAAPSLPFEATVTVKLDDEKGAAGLAFHADGKDRHYGFYPSGGKLRLVRFNGSDVFAWKVMQEKGAPAYRPGDWNALRVRVEKGRLKCWVNGEMVFDHEDDAFTSGKVGLAKFRDTAAEFKFFRVAKELPASVVPPGLITKAEKALAAGMSADALRKLPAGKSGTLAALRERARELERQAEQLRKLALALHQREVLNQLSAVVEKKEIDLVHAALLVAKLDNDELDVDGYRSEVDRLVRKLQAKIPAKATEAQKLAALDRFLFREKGFHGSRGDYYNRSNSYLSEVLDDREGLPITLSLVYIALAGKIGVKVEGVGLPGHFVVRHVPAKGKPQLIDVFDGGTRMSRADANRKVQEITGKALEDDDLKAVQPRQFLIRLVSNLLSIARREDDLPALVRYADAIVTLDPKSGENRGLRAALRFQAGDLKGASEDVDWMLKNKPEGIDLERVEQMRRYLDKVMRERKR
jgi:regulator of sirC expression with transglutaminase-like and TPR domain